MKVFHTDVIAAPRISEYHAAKRKATAKCMRAITMGLLTGLSSPSIS